MGADLITAWADVPAFDDPQQEMDTEACRATCLRRIEAFLTRDDAREVMDEVTDWSMGMSLEEALEECNLEPHEWVDYSRRVLTDHVNELFPTGGGWCRDTTTLMVHGHQILLVGGTSWGDSFPALDAMSALLQAGVLTAETGSDRPPTNVIKVG